MDGNDSRRNADYELPSRRVVLLGASNLTRGIATVVDACQRVWGDPLDVMAALGHGRSYGTPSNVLGRGLPSIVDSELWPALDLRPAVPTAALVTDIGNDLLYERPVENIVAWVAACVERLQHRDAQIVMTRLPLANIDGLPQWKFRLLRRAMFPQGRLPFAEIARRAHELDARLAELAARHGIVRVEQSTSWYGWDPIHLKRTVWPQAWHQILSPWQPVPSQAAPKNPPLTRRLYLRTRSPVQRWWWGIEQRAPQPCGFLDQGTIVSYF